MLNLTGFVKALEEGDRSKSTIQSYLADVKQFETQHIISNQLSLEDITSKDVKEYTSFLQKKGLAIKSINRKLASLSAYFRYLNEVEGLGLDIKIKSIKVANQSFINDSLTIDEIKRIIRQAEKRGDIRAITIMKALVLTGARISELLQIKVKDIDSDSIQVKGKGSKYRDILVSKKLKKQFKAYMEAREVDIESEFLFVGQRGAINRHTVHSIVKRYCGLARIRLDKGHCHAFRHVYAQELSKLGLTPVTISQLLGHELSVTGLYISQSKRELLKIVDRLDV